MDKEAIDKMAEIIDLAYRQDPNEPDVGTIGFVEFWSNQAITELGKLGYRKLPKDKPPLADISEAKKGHTAIIELHPSVFEDDIAIAQAQRDSDIKYYEEVSDNIC